MIPYLSFFPAVVLFTLAAEPWMEASIQHLALASAALIVIHTGLLRIHKTRIQEHLLQIEPDEGREDFPLRLGLQS